LHTLQARFLISHSRRLPALSGPIVLATPEKENRMNTRPNAGSANEALPDMTATLAKIDAGQEALLGADKSILDQMATMMGLLIRLIEIVTPDQDTQKGPTLSDLLAQLIAQQSAMLDIMKHTLETVVRIEERSLETAAKAAPCSISGK